MADGSGDYRILINRLRKSLQAFGVRAEGDESEPLPDQAYRLLVLVGTAALRHRIEIADESTLTNATKSLIVSRAVQIVSPHKDIHLDAAAYQIMEATALVVPDAQRVGEESPQGVIVTLLSAAGFLLTTLLMDGDSDQGLTVMHGEQPIPVPAVATLVSLARDRVQAALERLDAALRPE